MLLNFEDSLRDEHILLLALVYFCHSANLCILLGQLHRQNNLETLQTKYTASIVVEFGTDKTRRSVDP